MVCLKNLILTATPPQQEQQQRIQTTQTQHQPKHKIIHVSKSPWALLLFKKPIELRTTRFKPLYKKLGFSPYEISASSYK
jgi:hypothetical protein